MNSLVCSAKTRRSGLGGSALFRVLALTIGTFTASCAGTEPPILAFPVAPEPPPPTVTALRTILRSEPKRDALAFYESRQFRPVWTDEKAVAEVREALRHADEHGLRNADYALPAGMQRAPGRDAALFDIALTDAVLRYARDVRTGRFPDIYPDAELPQANYDFGAELRRALESGSVARYLAELAPSHPEYHRLAGALARYRTIADEGGWPAVPGKGEIRLDRKSPRLDALIARLKFEDAALDGMAKPSQAQVRDAIKRFQLRNGLPDDGRAGAETLAAMNIPAETRAAQIAANMERWRWMPRRLESRYITVNVPDQTVQFVRDGEVALKSKVVVGRKASPTPIIRTEIKTVVVNPPWNIPGDIAARDLLPHLKLSAN